MRSYSKSAQSSGDSAWLLGLSLAVLKTRRGARLINEKLLSSTILGTPSKVTFLHSLHLKWLVTANRQNWGLSATCWPQGRPT